MSGGLARLQLTYLAQPRPHKVHLHHAVGEGREVGVAIAVPPTHHIVRERVADQPLALRLEVDQVVVAVVRVADAAHELVDVQGAVMTVLRGHLICAAGRVQVHLVVEDRVAGGRLRHQGGAAHAKVLPRQRPQRTLALRAVLARDLVLVEQRQIVAPVALTHRTVVQSPVVAVLDIVILWLIAAAVDVGRVPGHGIAARLRPGQRVQAGLQIAGQGLTSQAGALVAKNGSNSWKDGVRAARADVRPSTHPVPFDKSMRLR